MVILVVDLVQWLLLRLVLGLGQVSDSSLGMWVMLLQLLVGAPLLLSGMRHLAGTVSDGYFPEGFSLPWAYLWNADHVLLLVWLGGAVAAIASSGTPERDRALLWLTSAGGAYLVLSSSAAVLG